MKTHRIFQIGLNVDLSPMRHVQDMWGVKI